MAAYRFQETARPWWLFAPLVKIVAPKSGSGDPDFVGNDGWASVSSDVFIMIPVNLHPLGGGQA